MRLALFLDRDGVINVDHGYVHTPETTDFVAGIFDLVATANRRGWLVVVVTNQAGIARGYYDEQQFNTYMAWVRAQFETRGAHIDAIYFCPHHPEHGLGDYRQQCDCRKPAPGMFQAAIRDLGIDPGSSVMVGDSATDMQAADVAGVGTLLLLGSEQVGPRSTNVRRITDLAEVIDALTPASGGRAGSVR
ncbi:D-alpha,beta-D-heptose 1,7-bisphosphate phosphatase [Pseudacidovorax intermedius]|uniref:D,D-heptose 1,7-bisphosphate phosphatase n=1 Tax=Pseudacidovorax intermedius TaxID=433924 RepID=A0A370FMQ1_9BURK|nr:D-glycero-beta-D-manno-heptose 1,7-bisphosphate 7-phosphatase [Pseudacidovorax intermedius]RDI28425.1 D-alpha,beta-D-heptose 1,7-bisphosphate phosphatase [Pseudacidovorax intermedius]